MTTIEITVDPPVFQPAALGGIQAYIAHGLRSFAREYDRRRIRGLDLSFTRSWSIEKWAGGAGGVLTIKVSQ